MKEPWSASNFRMDMNFDGRVTLSDTLLLLREIFFLPGDTILYFFVSIFPPMARSLNMGAQNSQGGFSLIVSLAVWGVVGYLLFGSLFSGGAGRRR